ncbi:MAG: trimeric intracellular cation channel family protein [Chryseobacterium sp.]|nr:MAG: trimeric intracellular cation channel family protein [Chryseobacterium sp.]
MELFNFDWGDVITICGTIAFAISGAFAAMQKRLDIFGVLIVAFVTSVGGGTLRDLIIGDTPVFWLLNANYSLLIIATSIIAMFFWKKIKRLKIPLFLFDSLGLGFFTVIGMEKGLAFDFGPGICIALGTITGCFGGIARDILLNNIPLIFRKEIYATACIMGGIVFFTLPLLGASIFWAKIVSVNVVFVIRIVAVKYNLVLPRFY